MTQVAFDRSTHPLGNPTPAYKVGETGDTVVYIFPSGNACVKKGKKTSQSEQPSKPSVLAPGYPKPPAPPKLPTRPQPPAPPKAAMTTTQPIGDRLVQAGLITATQLEVARYDQQSMNLEIEEVLIARGWIDEAALKRFLAA
ncbi:MAG: hypothetical protein F6K30_19620 [Cyanothece sp. SIO2G6]|nr:hypothetical protein [Cyanothece sp. SIO2G6]